ncbi:MAG: SDR family NAD(P)-dependent oxidoreductase [Thermoplasmatota archaeon]
MTKEPIAIIGTGCVLPDAPDVATFWNNLLAGKSSITEVPRERWDPTLYHSDDKTLPDMTYTKIGGFVADDAFNGIDYRMPPKVVDQIDPCQRWALAATRQAFQNAGYATGLKGDEGKAFDRDRCAVIVGNAMGGEVQKAVSKRVYWAEAEAAIRADSKFQTLPQEAQDEILSRAQAEFKATTNPITEDTLPGHLSNVVAGRIANAFDLGGKNFTTDAACASSFAALDAAVKTLRDQDSDLVIWGGTDRSMDVTAYIQFSKIGALSPDGSRPFDEGANGFVMGEGCAMFLLKRLSDAERDGDNIIATIRGIGSSSDGKGKGITAPNPSGQVKAVERAYKDAGVDPATIGYMEAHGTSTPVGDPVELESASKGISATTTQTIAPGSIRVGSVKSNIGHLKAAAGAAGVLKAALALKEGVLPPSINVKTLNPRIDWENSVFKVQTTQEGWVQEGPRRAAVSSFGFGGTNFHVVLEQHVPGAWQAPVATQAVAETRTELDLAGFQAGFNASLEPEAVVLSSAQAASLDLQTTNFAETGTGARLRDQLHPLTKEGVAANERVAFHVADVAEIPKKLGLAQKAMENPAAARLAFNQGVFLGRGAPEGKVAFLFPGQGTQYVNMGRDLAEKYEIVRKTFEEADEALFDDIGGKLTDILWPTPNTEENQKASNEKLKLTEYTQPAVLAMDLACLRLLQSWGIKPDMVAGHSLGEYGALMAAGVLSLKDALHAVAARGREMANVDLPDLGKMASISADWHDVQGFLDGVDGYVIPANKNCPSQTVIAGSTEGVENAVAKISEAGIQTMFLPVSAAFHSEIVAPASGPLRKVLGRLDVQSPKVPVITNVGARLYEDDPEWIRDNLAVQVASPVDWIDTIEKMYAEGVRYFIEVGPKRALSGFVMDILKDKQDVRAMFANHPKKGGIQSLNEMYAFLGASGFAPQVHALDDADVYTKSFLDPVAAFTKEVAVAAQPPITAPASNDPRTEVIANALTELNATLASMNGVTAAPQAATGTVDSQLQAKLDAYGICLDDITISGAAVGLPGGQLFGEDNWDRILRGDNLISEVPEPHRAGMVDRNIVRLVKGSDGQATFQSIQDMAQVIHLAGRRGGFDLAEWGIDMADVLDKTSQYAMAAGLETLRDAGIPLQRTYMQTSTGSFLPKEWKLPEPLRDGTGIIFASAFPGYDNLIDEISRHLADKYAGASLDRLQALYEELGGVVSDDEQKERLTKLFDEEFERLQAVLPDQGAARYEFNRKFLFTVLSMGHSQLAQLIGARGPNTQVNAACASTTQAIGIAEDWIRTGRARRVLVVGADDATSDNMLPWIGSGFLASGAATTKRNVADAALPFDARRHGMIIGMGAVGVLVEAAPEVEARGMRPIANLLATKVSNSAFHGSRLDIEHIASEMQALVGKALATRRATGRAANGETAESLAASTVFMSHETYTPARGGSAAAEIHALRATFGAGADRVVIANTKGFTGHPQGAGIEDAVVLKCLQRGQVPPIPNLKEPDAELGNLNLSKGGNYDIRYGLRLAAGFGSQVAMTFTELVARENERFANQAQYDAWLASVSGMPSAVVETVHRTLRIVDQGAPERVAPAAKPEPVAVQTPTTPAVPAVDALPTVIDLVAKKTGYPVEMLEPDLDLEADLGIDTVKQAELFGELREHFGVPLSDDLKLSDYNTLRKVADYMGGGNGASAQPAAAPATTTSTAPNVTVPTPQPVDPAASAPSADVLATVTAMIAEKTGYPPEMLEPALDLEADLGIDTVKQAELFGELREHFGIPLSDDLKLSDYNTLEKVAAYMGGGNAAPTPATPPPAATPTLAPIVGAQSPAAPAGDVLAKVTAVVAEKTGYPAEMLEADLDLEADLGIDTVKQAELFGELREMFGVSLSEDLSLADYNTLRKVASYMSGGAGTETAASAPPTPAVAPAQPGAETAPAADAGDVLAKVTAVVAEKTGYPVEMLEPALDLEADLGIDTVKQAELFGELREMFGVPLSEDLSLADYNTLEKVAGYMAAGGASATNTATEAAVEQATEAAPSGIQRLVPFARPQACEEDNHLPQGQLLVVGDADTEFMDAWKAAGFKPTMHHADAPVGILCLATRPGENAHTRAAALFEAAKANPNAFVVVATAQDGSHGLRKPRDAGMAAVSGLGKALNKELQGLVKVIDVDPADRDGPKRVVQEAMHGGLRCEVCFDRNGNRCVVEVAPESQQGTPDVAGKTLVVSGGAQGITAELLLQLAPQHPNLVLLGRTPLPREVADWANWTDEQWRAEELRVLEELKASGEKATPVMVKKRVDPMRKAVEVQRNITSMQAAGATVSYAAVDVTDAAGVAQVVSEARDKFGSIDGVIHAAGMEISKFLADKPREQFDLVFGIKHDGMNALVAATEQDDLSILAAFGSVAGRFGNIGQVDYSAANEYLCKEVKRVAQARGIPAAFTIAWGPWGEVGMATRGGIMTVLKESGVTPIPTADGIAAFMNELGTPGVRESVVCGEIGGLDADGQVVAHVWDPAVAEAESWLQTAPDRFRLLDSIEAINTERIVARLVMDRVKDPYLMDHAIDGVPLLPGVFGLEAFAEASRLLVPEDLDFIGAEAVRFAAPLKQHKDTPVTARIEALVLERGEETKVRCQLTSQFVGPDGRPLGEPKLHFEAVTRFGTGRTMRTGDVPVSDRSRTNVYPPFFHGPSFQVLPAAGPLGEESIGEFVFPEAPCFADGNATFLSHPLVTEALFQLCGLRTMDVDQRMSLPAAIERIDVFPGATGHGRLWSAYKGKEDLHQFDAAACTDDGTVLIRMVGYQMIETGPIADSEPAEPEGATDPAPAPSEPALPEPPAHVHLPDVEGLMFQWEPVKDAPLNDWFSAAEKETHAGFKTSKRAAEWRAGRIAAKRAVAASTGAPHNEIELRANDAGAPSLYVRGKPSPVRVSITHRDGVAIAAFGNDAIGIDLETVEPRSEPFWEQAFGADERRHLGAMANKDVAAACAWAAKEACLKRVGTGLDCALHDLVVRPEGGGAHVSGPFGQWYVRFWDLDGRVLAVTTPQFDVQVNA